MKFSGSSDNLARVLLNRAMRFHPASTAMPKVKWGSPKLGSKAAWGPGISLKGGSPKPVDLPKGDLNEPFEGGI